MSVGCELKLTYEECFILELDRMLSRRVLNYKIQKSKDLIVLILLKKEIRNVDLLTDITYLSKKHKLKSYEFNRVDDKLYFKFMI